MLLAAIAPRGACAIAILYTTPEQATFAMNFNDVQPCSQLDLSAKRGKPGGDLERR